MAESNDKTGLLNLTVAEFNALRGEIKDRSTIAYTLMNINITATTAIAGFVLSSKADPILLLILPLLSPALGMLFVDHSYNIDNLGSYIKSRLRPTAAAATGNPDVLGYEDFIDAYEQNKLFRFLPLGLPLTLLFAGPPLAGLLFTWEQLKDRWAWALWLAGLLMFIAFVWLWLRFLCAPYRKPKTTA
jgi:hypothetical protein